MGKRKRRGKRHEKQEFFDEKMDFEKFPTSKYKNYALQNTELFKLIGHCISHKEQAKNPHQTKTPTQAGIGSLE
jgi:hypothetical protein